MLKIIPSWLVFIFGIVRSFHGIEGVMAKRWHHLLGLFAGAIRLRCSMVVRLSITLARWYGSLFLIVLELSVNAMLKSPHSIVDSGIRDVACMRVVPESRDGGRYMNVIIVLLIKRVIEKFSH